MSVLSRFLGVRPAAAAVPIAVRVEPPVKAAAEVGSFGMGKPIWEMEGFGGQSRVKSLPYVSPVTAQRHGTVFACCNNIAGDHQKLPLEVWQRSTKGQPVRVDNHPASYLLNVESSPGVPATVIRYALFYAFCLRGRAYAWAPRDGGGELMMMDLAHPDRVSELQAGRARFYDFEDGDQIYRRAPSRTMIHLRYMAEDGWTGRSPIQVAAESMGLALAGQEAAARAASGTQMRAVMKLANVYEDDETYRRNAVRVRNALNDPDANGIPIIGEADDIKSLDLSASDQQLLESRKFDREQIAAVYRMPPSKLQIMEHGVKANGQQQAIDYRGECLTHWGSMFETQMAQTVLTEAERRKGLFLRHNYDELLMATTAERYAAGRLAVGGPWMTYREWRRMEGLPDLADGEAPYPPPNMTEKPGAAPKEGAQE